ncbi:MAG: transposase, partial [Patescibacteria group bacterium]
MFALKSPSLLAFEKDVRLSESVQGNLRQIFHIGQVPSDTTMREIIDEIPTEHLLKPFTRIFAALQRGKDLEPYVFMNGHYLVALDGTGYFSSSSVHCDCCGVKNHRNGTTTYYHQALSGVLIHPSQKVVIPFSPEP